MANGFQIKCAASLTDVVEVLSGPGALPFFNCLMALSTFVSSIYTNIILFC